MRWNRFMTGPRDEAPAPIPFPLHRPANADGKPGAERRPAAGEQAMAALADVSRRIEDLARELNCLGYFDDDLAGGPRAA